ncbi:MAG: diguanylate cyclase [Chitinivibrionales bacterium]|nr:diguanylate cyclase [Chitinivibrionales bacterium]MBD3396568.1 diguanylate cyclase [Chitinivibrionales bacterium]
MEEAPSPGTGPEKQPRRLFSTEDLENLDNLDDIRIEASTGQVEDTAAVNIEDIDNLKELTDRKVIELASGDLVSHIKEDLTAITQLGKREGAYYRDLIFALVHIRLPEEEARRDWQEILKHKYSMSEALGRNVGIHVAALDYYTNIKRRVSTPKIIDAHEYADTASRAITDELTRAYNRGFFDEEFKKYFVIARTSNRPFSLIILDLDHFKAYNDFAGHIQGDIALIETVRILHAVCSTDDVVARYGGEEFVILLPGQGVDKAVDKAEHIRRAVYDYRFVNEQDLPGGRLSVSLGVTSYRPDIARPSEMLEEADVALYRAKNGGRNRVKVFLRGADGEAQP